MAKTGAAFTARSELIHYLHRALLSQSGLGIWLQIYFEQCLMCGVKSSLAFVKPSPLLLRNCSHLCPKDEG